MNDFNLFFFSYIVNEVRFKLDLVCEIKIIKLDLKFFVEIV